MADALAIDMDGQNHKGRPIWSAMLRLALLLQVPITWAALVRGDHFTVYQIQTQDLPILLALPILLVLVARWAPGWALPQRLPAPSILFGLGLGLALLLAWATYPLMGALPLSRDEHMVVFDATVFSAGQLAAPLAPEWRDFAKALVPAFLLESVAPGALVSSYLPTNAMLRAAFGVLADPVLLNPLLALVGGVALWEIARRQFGDDHRARAVVLLIYATSAQMLVASMTTYAMTAHMALNMVWLWGFLRGGRLGHVAAIVAGSVAVGLHQLVFHLLFAAPFLLWRLRDGHWRTVLLYGAAYLLILGWWIAYPRLVVLAAGAWAPGAVPGNGFFADRVVPLFTYRDPLTIPLMTSNLLRFVAWQNLALVPLLAAALPLAWRDRGIAGPLLWGIAASVVLITIVLPYQGHGWGYRYLHPMLGSFAILAGFGYRRLAARLPGRVDGALIALSAFTIVGSIPLLVTRSYQFVAPHVALEEAILARKADFVVIDTDGAVGTDGRWSVNAIDHVRNDPYLRNRPLRFSGRDLDQAAIQQLCRRGTLSIVDRSDMQRVGFAMNAVPFNPTFEALTANIADQPCFVKE